MSLFDDLAVAILAGGKSSRFGQKKARTRLQHKELIDYSLELASHLTRDYFIVQGKTDDFQDKGVPVFTDIVPDCGPLGGLLTAVKSTRASWLATLPCDMPLLVPEIYHLLFKNRRRMRPVVAVSHAGIEPLIAVWPRKTVTLISERIGEGVLGMHQIFSSLNAMKVHMPGKLKNYRPEYFYNINRREDLKEFPFDFL